MTDNKEELLQQLTAFGLSSEEATIYLALLERPSTALQVSRSTGIARTTVYRLVDQLEKRSLVSKHVDDRGPFIVASDPASLEVEIVTTEKIAEQKRELLSSLLPRLGQIQKEGDSDFAVRTYEGEEGFKQMCWHELKTIGELVNFGSGTIEELIPRRRWAEKHRQLSVEANYRVRELINDKIDIPTFTSNQEYMQQYACRSLPKEILPFDNQTVIYNDTVSIYHWRDGKRIGIEIISESYAAMMRTMFEHYWEMATPSALVLTTKQ